MKHLKTFESFDSEVTEITKEEFSSFEEFKNYYEENKEKFEDTLWDIIPHLNNASDYFNNFLENTFIVVFEDGKVCCGCFTDETGEPKEGACMSYNDRPVSKDEFKSLLSKVK